MDKRAQGLSINVIIIVAIALIVLIVLIAVFTGRLGVFTSGLKGSVTCDAVCKSAGYKTGGDVTPDKGVQTVGLRDSNNEPCTCKE